MDRPIVAVTTGDPGGIGPEIAAKSLALGEIYRFCRPLVIGDGTLMNEAIRIAKVDLKVNRIAEPEQGLFRHGTLDVLDLHNVELDRLEYGTVSAVGGKASFEYITKAIELAMTGRVGAVTTGPIHKEAINSAGYPYAGHTEIFASLTGTKDYCMMLLEKCFRVSHVTTHVPFRAVADLIKSDRILTTIRLTWDSLVRMGINRPRIAVAGLNPHAGDGGLFGKEEIEEIIPAVEQARDKGMVVDGPYPPDTIFVRHKGGEHDAVVAMYHDQGHIPVKLVGFNYDRTTNQWGNVAGVNLTLGLPLIRTSVDHGVAFGKAGNGTANPQSMIEAIKLAATMAVHNL